MEIKYITIDKIVANKEQPRMYFDDEKIAMLAESIKQYGVLQPIIIKEDGELYKIIAGERRFRASVIAGLKEVPVIIKDADRYDTSRIAIVENLQREDLSAIEEAYAYQTLIRDYELTQSEVSKAVNKKPSTISNKLRLLKLDREVQEAIKVGKISERHGRALLSVDATEQKKMLAQIIDEEMTVSATEKKIKSRVKKRSNKSRVSKMVVSKDFKLAQNTIKQAVSLIEKTGANVDYQEVIAEDEVQFVIKVTKE